MDFKLFLESSIIKPYVLPNNKEELFYDFYMCSLLLPQSRKAEIPRNIEPTTKKQPIPLNIKQKSITSESYSYLEEAETELKRAFELIVKKIKEDFLHSLFFGIVSEIRYVAKASGWKNYVRDKNKGFYEDFLDIKMISSFGYEHDLKVKTEDIENHDLFKIFQYEKKKENKSERVLFFGKILEAMVRNNVSDEEVVEFCFEIFENAEWDYLFGGKSWAKVCEAYLNLKKATTINEIAIQIDHIFDLQHNTGASINKSLLWAINDSPAKYGGSGELLEERILGFEWLDLALELKAHIKSPYELIPFISQQLKNIVAPILKEKNRFGLDSPQAKKLMLGEKYTEIDQLLIGEKTKNAIIKASILLTYNKNPSLRKGFLHPTEIIKLLRIWAETGRGVQTINLPLDTKEIILNQLKGNYIEIFAVKYDIYEKCFIYAIARNIPNSPNVAVIKYFPENKKIIIEKTDEKHHYEEDITHLEIKRLVNQSNMNLKEFLEILKKLNVIGSKVINTNLRISNERKHQSKVANLIKWDKTGKKITYEINNDYVYLTLEEILKSMYNNFIVNHQLDSIINVDHKAVGLQPFDQFTMSIEPPIDEIWSSLNEKFPSLPKLLPDKKAIMECWLNYIFKSISDSKKNPVELNLDSLHYFILEMHKIKSETENYYFSNETTVATPTVRRIRLGENNYEIKINCKFARILIGPKIFGYNTLTIRVSSELIKDKTPRDFIESSYNYSVDWLPEWVQEEIGFLADACKRSISLFKSTTK